MTPAPSPATAFADVALPVPLPGPFVYAVPETLEPVTVGSRVLVPFGPRILTGVLVATGAEPEAELRAKVRPIERMIDAEPLFSADLFDLIQFAADYYSATTGEVMKTAVPPGILPAGHRVWKLTKAGREALREATLDLPPAQQSLLERLKSRPLRVQSKLASPGKALAARGLVTKSHSLRVIDLDTNTPPSPDANDPAVAQAQSLPPTPAQAAALEAILSSIDEGECARFLLHGVTGSGKTEVYLQAIQRCLERGQTAIVLVPEIALTEHLSARFQERFGDQVAVLHSGLSDKVRRERWFGLRSGQLRVAVGARSTIWAPVPRLGLIIVDEEHDASFKQNSDVRYHARDLALKRGRLASATTILGSATPSLETLHSARTGRITELRLPRRVGKSRLPTIEIVDLKEAQRRHGNTELLSVELRDRLQETIEGGRQGIIFLNRRGFNTVVYCADCAAPRLCPHCDVSLTHHARAKRLRCHHCDYQTKNQSACPSCGSHAQVPHGAGTERVEQAILETIPGARTLRLDRDTVTSVHEIEDVLSSFRNREADVLIGTQMVAKGHDFPGVGFVGIVLADAALALPDFRSAERCFQLLTQVAGRAGRRDEAGYVVIQSFQPDHYTIQCALDHDTDRFFEIECAQREALGYPPFGRLATVRVESEDLVKAQRGAETLAERLRSFAPPRTVRIRGPAPCPIGRVRAHYRYMILLVAASPAALVHVLQRCKSSLSDLKRIRVSIDMDAQDLL